MPLAKGVARESVSHRCGKQHGHRSKQSEYIALDEPAPTFLLHLSDIYHHEAAGHQVVGIWNIEMTPPVMPVTDQRGTACEKER
jgi:hypothetical protein